MFGEFSKEELFCDTFWNVRGALGDEAKEQLWLRLRVNVQSQEETWTLEELGKEQKSLRTV